MPAFVEEIEEAEFEGVELRFLMSPVEVKAEGTGLKVSCRSWNWANQTIQDAADPCL